VALVDRAQGVDGQQVLHVGEQQFLVLLLVVQAEFDQAQRVRAVGVFDEVGDARVHLLAPLPHGGEVGPREQAALRSREGLADALVVAVEEHAERGVERLEALLEAFEHEGLEEPRDVREVPFGRAGIGHGLGLAVLGRERRGQRAAAFAHRCVVAREPRAVGPWVGRTLWGNRSGRGVHGVSFRA